MTDPSPPDPRDDPLRTEAAPQSGPARDPQRQRESEPEPEFGLVDVIEAFTALRHEFRTNTRESRSLVSQVDESTRRIEDLVRRTTRTLAESNSDRGVDPRPWVDTLVEIDLNVSRAVDAAEKSWGNRVSNSDASEPSRTGQPDVAAAIDRGVADRFAAMGAFRRWFCRGFFAETRDVIDKHAEPRQPTRPVDPTAEGLRMLVDRIRHLLARHEIERVDTVGAMFDGRTMNAIESLESSEHPPGTVLRQFGPAYRWRGDLVRYAEVCVAKTS